MILSRSVLPGSRREIVHAVGSVLAQSSRRSGIRLNDVQNSYAALIRSSSFRRLAATGSESSDGSVLEPRPLTPEELGPFVSRLPAAWIPYAELSRLEKPVGTWLLYSPCTWSITMAAYLTSAPISQTVSMLAVFGVGALVMRGAGCTINDLLDRKLDSQVARTVGRPIASGRVSKNQAVAWLGAQCTVGLGILLSLPKECWMLGAMSVPLVFAYPLFKRFTYYPQAMLSLCFNWGALLGFPAMGVWDWKIMLPLFLSSFNWCMIYDTIYAHQDKKFDVVAGIKSTALKWGSRTKPILTGLGVAQFSLMAMAGYFAGMGPGFWLLSVGLGGYRVARMIRRVDLDNPKNCWKWFTNNISTGHWMFAGILTDYLLRLAGMF